MFLGLAGSGEAPVADKPAHQRWRDERDGDIDFGAWLHRAYRDRRLLVHHIALDKHETARLGPRILAIVAEPPCFDDPLRGGHSGVVSDGHIGHETRR
jgi:hypothetical protein